MQMLPAKNTFKSSVLWRCHGLETHFSLWSLGRCQEVGYMISNRKLCRSSVCLCERWAARGSFIFKDGFDKSKLDMNGLLDNQSLLASITACAWYWSASRPLTSEAAAACIKFTRCLSLFPCFPSWLGIWDFIRTNWLRLQLFAWTVLRLENLKYQPDPP